MTIHLTEEGRIHFAQRLDGDTPTYNFAYIEFGTGDTPTSTTDNYSTMVNKIAGTLIQAASGWPRRPEIDGANTGGGNNILSYKFAIGSGVASFNATNLHLTVATPTATSPVAIVGTGLTIQHTLGDSDTFYLNVKVS